MDWFFIILRNWLRLGYWTLDMQIFSHANILFDLGKQSVMNDQDVEHVGQTHTKQSARVEECSPDVRCNF